MKKTTAVPPVLLSSDEDSIHLSAEVAALCDSIKKFYSENCLKQQDTSTPPGCKSASVLLSHEISKLIRLDFKFYRDLLLEDGYYLSYQVPTVPDSLVVVTYFTISSFINSAVPATVCNKQQEVPGGQGTGDLTGSSHRIDVVDSSLDDIKSNTLLSLPPCFSNSESGLCSLISSASALCREANNPSKQVVNWIFFAYCKDDSRVDRDSGKNLSNREYFKQCFHGSYEFIIIGSHFSEGVYYYMGFIVCSKRFSLRNVRDKIPIARWFSIYRGVCAWEVSQFILDYVTRNTLSRGEYIMDGKCPIAPKRCSKPLVPVASNTYGSIFKKEDTLSECRSSEDDEDMEFWQSPLLLSAKKRTRSSSSSSPSTIVKQEASLERPSKKAKRDLSPSRYASTLPNLDFSRSVLLYGDDISGMTNWVSGKFKNPLVVQQRFTNLKNFSQSENDAIIFVALNFYKWQLERLLELVNRNFTYNSYWKDVGTLEIPRGIPVCFISQVSNPFYDITKVLVCQAQEIDCKVIRYPIGSVFV